MSEYEKLTNLLISAADSIQNSESASFHEAIDRRREIQNLIEQIDNAIREAELKGFKDGFDRGYAQAFPITPRPKGIL